MDTCHFGSGEMAPAPDSPGLCWGLMWRSQSLYGEPASTCRGESWILPSVEFGLKDIPHVKVLKGGRVIQSQLPGIALRWAGCRDTPVLLPACWHGPGHTCAGPSSLALTLPASSVCPALHRAAGARSCCSPSCWHC